MTLRVQYALRQALAVALFGLPLPLLEQILRQTISSHQIEVIPTLLTRIVIPSVILLAFVTFLLAYERFDDEFDPPLERTAIVCGWLRGVFILGITCAVALGSTGWPANQYQGARSGIIAAGLWLGWLLAKWVYFDWIERIRDHPDNPEEPPATGAIVSPILPSGSTAHSSLMQATACDPTSI